MRTYNQRGMQAAASRRQGFTMVEMVGVLAVIAVLAAMLTPKILSAVNDARINSTVSSLNAVKGATVNYFSKYGNFTNMTSFDNLLVTLEFLERPFDCRVGSGADCQVVSGPGFAGLGYKFDGVTTNTASAGVVVECLISNVYIADAWALSLQMDGAALSATNNSTADTSGRVEYNFSSGKGTVYVYMAHR